MPSKWALAALSVTLAALIVACGESSNQSGTTSIPARVRAGLLEYARRRAAISGDPHPYDIEAVRTTYGQARAFRGQSQPEDPNPPVYLVAMRGDFRHNGLSPLSGGGAKKAPLTVMEFEVDIGPREDPGAAVAWGSRYPNLNELGQPVRLG